MCNHCDLLLSTRLLRLANTGAERILYHCRIGTLKPEIRIAPQVLSWYIPVVCQEFNDFMKVVSYSELTGEMRIAYMYNKSIIKRARERNVRHQYITCIESVVIIRGDNIMSLKTESEKEDVMQTF